MKTFVDCRPWPKESNHNVLEANRVAKPWQHQGQNCFPLQTRLDNQTIISTRKILPHRRNEGTGWGPRKRLIWMLECACRKRRGSFDVEWGDGLAHCRHVGLSAKRLRREKCTRLCLRENTLKQFLPHSHGDAPSPHCNWHQPCSPLHCVNELKLGSKCNKMTQWNSDNVYIQNTPVPLHKYNSWFSCWTNLLLPWRL